MINLFLEIQSLVMNYKHLGFEETTYAKLYARATHIAPQAWLHALFKPLQENEINLIKGEIKNLPDFYENFLRVCNGLSLFGTTLSLFGFRRDVKRNLDSVWQPFDLVDLNSFDRPTDSNDSLFFFGSYDWDGSLVYYDENRHCICRCSSESVKPINQWLSFENFVFSELERLPLLFDKNGVQIDNNKETV